MDIFFVISGFIMMYTSESRFCRRGAATDFIIRRLIRIVPLYWLCTLVILALMLTGIFYKHKAISVAIVINSLFFMPTYGRILSVGWTLQYEMYFYVLFACCIRFASARSTTIILPLILLGMMGLSAFFQDGPLRLFFADPIALEFVYGLWLGYAFSRGSLPKMSSYTLIFLGLAGLAAASVAMPSNGTAGLSIGVRYVAWGVPAALLVFAALNLRTSTGAAGRALDFIGGASYSIYLTHAISIAVYAKTIKNEAIAQILPPALWIALATAASMAIGMLSYKLIEQPISQKLNRLWQNWTLKAAAHGTAKPA